jgi:hypothetical protein
MLKVKNPALTEYLQEFPKVKTILSVQGEQVLHVAQLMHFGHTDYGWPDFHDTCIASIPLHKSQLATTLNAKHVHHAKMPVGSAFATWDHRSTILFRRCILFLAQSFSLDRKWVSDISSRCMGDRIFLKQATAGSFVEHNKIILTLVISLKTFELAAATAKISQDSILFGPLASSISRQLNSVLRRCSPSPLPEFYHLPFAINQTLLLCNNDG